MRKTPGIVIHTFEYGKKQIFLVPACNKKLGLLYIKIKSKKIVFFKVFVVLSNESYLFKARFTKPNLETYLSLSNLRFTGHSIFLFSHYMSCL